MVYLFVVFDQIPRCLVTRIHNDLVHPALEARILHDNLRIPRLRNRWRHLSGLQHIVQHNRIRRLEEPINKLRNLLKRQRIPSKYLPSYQSNLLTPHKNNATTHRLQRRIRPNQPPLILILQITNLDIIPQRADHPRAALLLHADDVRELGRDFPLVRVVLEVQDDAQARLRVAHAPDGEAIERGRGGGGGCLRAVPLR